MKGIRISMLMLLAAGWILAGIGCVTNSGGSGTGSGRQGEGSKDVSAADFNAVRNDYGTIGMTVPPPYRIDGKVGGKQYTPATLGEVTTFLSRLGALTTFSWNNAEFEILNKGGVEAEPVLTLIVHAAGKMDLSKDENVEPFIVNLRQLFAEHPETWRFHVRLDGRILALRGPVSAESHAPRMVITGGVPGKDMVVDMGGGVKMEFVWITPGNFMMGSPEEEGSYNQGPQHHVTIGKGFWMGKYEVTQEQWERVMGRNPSEFTGVGGKAPVEHVSWEDCLKFISRMNTALGATNRPVTVRLPTESQWEYACRAGATTLYSEGNTEQDLDRVGWHAGNSGGSTHPVGQKKANAWGLHDMHGNVWEWCVSKNRSYSIDPQVDPDEAPGREWKFFRGGSHSTYPSSCTSAERWDASPPLDQRPFTIGFRVVAIQ